MRILKPLILCLTIILFTNCNNDDDSQNQNDASSTVELQKDREALIEIYNANTSNTLTWDITSTNLSTWEGIVVENNRVAVLNIGNKNIETLPETALQQLTALRNLTANDNTLTLVNISYNINLKSLQLFNNQLDAISLSTNTLLEQVLVENNNIESLDVSMLSNLIDLKAKQNNLTNTINIANGNNSNMWRMEVGINPNLSCIQVDVGATNGYNGWLKDSNMIYSTSCM